MPGPDPYMRHEIDDLFARHMAYETERLAQGQISLSDWQINMREDIRRAHALQLIAGAGGDPALIDPNDWLRLGSTIRSQDKYLEQFAQQILDGEVDPASIGSRAEMYARAAGAEYSRQATKEADLPAHPRDGSTACLGNCGCQWVEMDDGWYWVRGKTDSCDDCIQRERDWAPYQAGD
jgi:hypothetical protein